MLPQPNDLNPTVKSSAKQNYSNSHLNSKVKRLVLALQLASLCRKLALASNFLFPWIFVCQRLLQIFELIWSQTSPDRDKSIQEEVFDSKVQTRWKFSSIQDKFKT